MSKNFVPAKYDFVFKLLFGDHHNIDLLTALLQATLDLPKSEYDRIELASPFFLRRWHRDKQGVLDVKIHTASGKIIDVEIQVKPHEKMRERIIYYLARMVDEQLWRGDEYEKIKPVISIVITDFKLIPETAGYRSHFVLYDPETKTQFSDILHVYILEMPKMPAEPDGNPLWDWLALIKTEDEKELDMLAKKSPELQKAAAIVKYASFPKRLREYIISQRVAETDRRLQDKWIRDHARDEGRDEGIQLGRAEAATQYEARIAELERQVRESREGTDR